MTLKKLAAEMVAMAEEDQRMRQAAQVGKKSFDKSVNVENSNRLKQIIDQIHAWPTISMVGEEASYAAWLIVQHADHDSTFQERCLKLMFQAEDDVLLSNIAYLADRVAVNKENGELVPRPIKNPEGLDVRRLKVGNE